MEYIVHSEFFSENMFPVFEFKPKSGSIGNLLFLHGAGKADGRRMFPICHELVQKGFRCVSFDIVGHGESSRAIENTTLRDRFEQTQFVFEKYFQESISGVISFSMSGQAAVELASRHAKIPRLVLCAPAMYSARAYDVNFGEDFSSIIREPSSWKDSPILSNLETIKADRLVVVGENDSVIPREITDNYGLTTIGSGRSYRVTLKNEGHMLSGRTNEDAAFASYLSRIIEDFILSYKSADAL